MSNTPKPTPVAASRVRLPAAEVKASQVRPLDTHQMKTTVISPTGEVVEVERHAANDLVRHLGWKWGHSGSSGEAVAETEAPEQGEQPKDDSSEGAAPSDELPSDDAAQHLDPAVQELANLRDEAKDLGIEVNPAWGKRRLRDEIAKKRA